VKFDEEFDSKQDFFYYNRILFSIRENKAYRLKKIDDKITI